MNFRFKIYSSLFFLLLQIGDIYFNYLHIPKVKISNLHHVHRIGLSDAYMAQRSAHEYIVRVITLYHKINLDEEKITDGVSVIFRMDQSKYFIFFRDLSEFHGILILEKF